MPKYQKLKTINKHPVTSCNGSLTNIFFSLSSSNLMDVYSGRAQYDAEWNALKKSPLVVDEGQGKFLRLQFDVSQFEVEEVRRAFKYFFDTAAVVDHISFDIDGCTV